MSVSSWCCRFKHVRIGCGVVGRIWCVWIGQLPLMVSGGENASTGYHRVEEYHFTRCRYATRTSYDRAVRPSVRSSVRHTRVLRQNERKFCRHSYTVWQENSSSLPTRRMIGGGRPLLPEILDLNRPRQKKSILQSFFVWKLSAAKL